MRGKTFGFTMTCPRTCRRRRNSTRCSCHGSCSDTTLLAATGKSGSRPGCRRSATRRHVAMRTAGGRERLEALLAQFERDAEGSQRSASDDVDFVRSELGLSKPTLSTTRANSACRFLQVRALVASNNRFRGRGDASGRHSPRCRRRTASIGIGMNKLHAYSQPLGWRVFCGRQPLSRNQRTLIAADPGKSGRLSRVVLDRGVPRTTACADRFDKSATTSRS